jgi:hypothetical protein
VHFALFAIVLDEYDCGHEPWIPRENSIDRASGGL